MSTIVYAELTNKREAAPARTSTTTSQPGMKTYVDALSALIPAEVMTLHALTLSATTEIEGTITRISAADSLRFAFWGLILISLFFYTAPRLAGRHWDRLDWVRMLLPPLAFVAWTMLQRSTAFDAAFPGVSDASRTVGGLFLAAVLCAMASWMAIQLDHKDPPPI